MYRTAGLLAVLALMISACTGADTATSEVPDEFASPPSTVDSPATETTASPIPSPTVTFPPNGFPQGPSALDEVGAPEFPAPLVSPEEIISGGPPPDGIPPIDEPVFISVEAADDWLDGSEPVVLLDIGGDVRAYPVQIMIWHEIVNDSVGGVPVSVTYCPLCNSAVSFVREVEGNETTFGTSGRLFASALVMYDRATESLWTHYDGRAVVGLLTGQQLEPVSSPLLAWAEFKKSFPDGMVLDRDATGFARTYGRNPYVGYDNPDERPFLFRGAVDDRARALQRVVGVRTDSAARAWALDVVSGGEAKATNSEVGDTAVVIFWRAGQASALDTGEIIEGRDVGSVGVFSPIVEGQTLTFAADGSDFVDDQTGTVWDVTGQAIDGELAGTRLESVLHLDTFWFAWSTYSPGTDLVE